MKEDFLHMVWLHRWMNTANLRTTSGSALEILRTGNHNLSSGPDFLEARLKIDDTEWAGSVEIHVRSSDWYKHQHQFDDHYQNVILHVVYYHDQEVLTSDNNHIPTLELSGRISKTMFNRYEALLRNRGDIACASYLGSVKDLTWGMWLDRVLYERLAQKVEVLEAIQFSNQRDWLQSAFRLLARYLGAGFNKEPMEELSRIVPLNLLLRLDDSIDREAILLGSAGFLDQLNIEINQDGYLHSMVRRFEFLQKKHSLTKSTQQWRTGKVRPLNHPERRIAQLSALVPFIPELLKQLFDGKLPEWNRIDLAISDFWRHHYSLKSSSLKALPIGISKDISDLLNINVSAPLLFHYAEIIGDDDLKQASLDGLHQIKSEANNIVRSFERINVKSKSAAQSQALFHLKQFYCNPKKCVLCNIGKHILTDK